MMQPIIKQHVDRLNRKQLKTMLQNAKEERAFRKQNSPDRVPAIEEEIKYINSKIN